MTVNIAQNIKRERQMIDFEGNTIDPRTKQVIAFKEKEFVPTPEQLAFKANAPVEGDSEALQAPTATVNKESTAISIQEEIKQNEARIIELKALLSEKIEEMRAQLAALESN